MEEFTWTKRLRPVLTLFVIVGLLVVIYNVIPVEDKDYVKQLVLHPSKAAKMPVGRFIAFSTVGFALPGIPGSALFVLSGRFYGITRGFFVILLSNQIGCSIGFLFCRFFLFHRVQNLVNSRPNLRALSKAAELEAWKITFLARFIFLPTQLKNYVFGVLPVSFRCFFFMTLLGDIFSAYAGAYLGYLTTVTQEAKGFDMEYLFTVVGFTLAVLTTIVASVVARRAYNRVIRDLAKAPSSRSFDEGSGYRASRSSSRTSQGYNTFEKSDDYRLFSGMKRVLTRKGRESDAGNEDLEMQPLVEGDD